MACHIIMDAMGGDHAPGAIVQGVVQALPAFEGTVTMYGMEDAIRKALDDCDAPQDIRARIQIRAAEQVITMEDDPVDVVRKKKQSSMTLALKALANGEGDAFVGAGNTGAMFMGASMIVRPLYGIRRAALATILPMEHPLLMLDCGANVTVTPQHLVQFAQMGTVYMQELFDISAPRVGLLNNGAEAHKGTPLQVEAYQQLQQSAALHFVGNVEGNEIPFGRCDVLVTDGFTGNVTLKFAEGMGRFLMRQVKGLFLSNVMTKLSFLLFRRNLVALKSKFNASEYGGSPFLGLSKPVIKAHGSSDAYAVKNAILQAVAYVEKDVTARIAAGIAQEQQTQSGQSPVNETLNDETAH